MIYIQHRLIRRGRYKNITEENVAGETGFSRFNENPKEPDSDNFYLYFFRAKDTALRSGVVETGFFSSCIHIDKGGLYEKSILHDEDVLNEVRSFEYEQDILDLIREVGVLDTKFKQPDNSVKWGGVVFASQNPHDRSVGTVGGHKKWYQFLEESCKYYGKDLFIKFHHLNERKDQVDGIKQIADKYGCSYGFSDHTCIENCDHVVLGTSTFTVDCMLRGVPVKQGMLGYFDGVDAVTYCDGDPSIKIVDREERIKEGRQLGNFLAHRYCFRIDSSWQQWRNILNAFNSSENKAPLPEENSYYSYLKGLVKK
jgi:hypothetical protein